MEASISLFHLYTFSVFVRNKHTNKVVRQNGVKKVFFISLIYFFQDYISAYGSVKLSKWTDIIKKHDMTSAW